jgi:hypothetical protein
MRTNRGRPIALALTLAWLLPATAVGQSQLEGSSRQELVLEDGTRVTLYREWISPVGTRGPSTRVGRDRRARDHFRKTLSEARKQQLLEAQQKRNAAEQKRAKARVQAKPKQGNRWYYVPPVSGLRVAPGENGTPKFLFLTYMTDAPEAGGGVAGGLLHVLMEMGLSAEQLSDLRDKVKTELKGELAGAVDLQELTDGESFSIQSATLQSGDQFTRTELTSGRAPRTAGGRFAVVANLTPVGAELLGATFDKTSAQGDLTISLRYNFPVVVNAGDCTFRMDWSRFESQKESINASYQKKTPRRRNSKDDGCAMGCDAGDIAAGAAIGAGVGSLFFGVGAIPGAVIGGMMAADSAEKDRKKKQRRQAESSGPRYRYDEVHNQFQSLFEHNVIETRCGPTQGNDPGAAERQAQLQQLAFQMFMSMATVPTLPQPSSGEDDGEQGVDREIPDIKKGSRYTYNVEFLRSLKQQKTMELRMENYTTILMPVDIDGGIGDWYQAVQDNKSCVNTVILDEKWHGDIRLELDRDAKDLFDEMVNYVTVRVRKERAGHKAFDRSLTIDEAYVKDNGFVANLSYANPDGEDADYQYAAQWSLRGGVLWPPDISWRPGTVETIPLNAPIEPIEVSVEGDLDWMEINGLRRATIELHYRQLGEERVEMFHISPRGEDLVTKRLWVTRQAPGFRYRIILYEKDGKKLVFPWSEETNEEYIVAVVPDEQLVSDDIRQVAREAGAKLGKLGAEKVLDMLGLGGE